ncbi:MAG: GNAT family N-acetyltransferase [Deltaproteobacteria bacterium]|nr:GNAT family N-acetyltransferase [Deltaproteobacteria bacterium]
MDRPFLVGEKIYLRAFDMDDLEGDYIQWMNDGEIIRHLASNAFPKTKDELKRYVEQMIHNPDYVFFAVIEKSTGKHVGNAKLGPINWIDRRTHYGRVMSKETWGKGYGSEVLKLMIKYAFEILNLNRMIDFIVSSNLGSIRSNQKAGMDVEGEIKEWAYKDGKY